MANEKKPEPKKNAARTIVLWVILIFGALLIVGLLGSRGGGEQELSYTEFRTEVEQGNVSEVTIVEQDLSGELVAPMRTEGGEEVSAFKTHLPFTDTRELSNELSDKGIQVKSKPKQVIWDILIGYLPWLGLFLIFWFFIARQLRSGPNRAFSFGKSRVKLVSEDRPKVTFDDVAGVDEAKEELKEVIEFLRSPEKFRRLGAKIPKGVLLLGPPGTGKTLLAKAVAGEARVPFLSISGSDFVELFVGVGAARVRDLFEQAKSHSPCIVFIDEIDAVGRLRGAGLGGGHDEREQTLNQLLVQMDGFDTSEGIVVMAATNRPDILDMALLRPGRFDRRIVVDRPDVKGREEILRIHSKNVILSENVDFESIAKGTPGFSGADLANLVNEAALLAARKASGSVSNGDFEEAKDKVLMGVARKSMVISEDEKRKIAIHEAGHTLVSKFTPGADPIHKVSIIPRGMALGVTQQLPEDDMHIYSKTYLEGKLDYALGGREAEKLLLQEISTGAGDDLERATELARKMVCEWGMSEKLGPVTIGKPSEEVFIGREFGVKRAYSENVARLIDDEVRRLITEAGERAQRILEAHETELVKLSEILLEKETLEADEIDDLLGFPRPGAEAEPPRTPAQDDLKERETVAGPEE
jgi:cell division protease FtsH